MTEEAVTWLEYFKDKTDDHLIVSAKALHWLIFGPDACYGKRDLIEYEATLEELERRGWHTYESIEFVKEELDEEAEL